MSGTVRGQMHLFVHLEWKDQSCYEIGLFSILSFTVPGKNPVVHKWRAVSYTAQRKKPLRR
ncbi:hypothetical protein [Bacillus sp. AFS031507]|uniref:hypothetical protein n=1 Tax=Bacillus sp. AFS031507 TaxID=2033496 RepID=UPI001156365C|nr:hypothetical protein [Bacillus sp. AFS031507]